MGHRTVLSLLLLSSGFCLLPTPGSGATARPRGVAGLDSLAAETLFMALDDLEIGPADLGFDKLYAEDDTFRLAVVEDLLADPLRVPGWQEEVTGKVRGAVHDPVALVEEMALLCDAGGRKVAGRGPWPGSGAGQDRSSGPFDAAAAGFLDAMAECQTLLDEAFAAFTDGERESLLAFAPVVWGDWEEPAEAARKGLLHREAGVEADTTFKLEEDLLLDLGAKLDRPALTDAAAAFLRAVADLPALAAGVASAPGIAPLPGVMGTVLAAEETPWGLLVVGGEDANLYTEEALSRIAFLVDLGGDDVYRGRAASAVGGLHRSFSALVDLEGDDFYDARDFAFALGGAILGVAVLVDAAGNDTYRGEDGSAGAGFFGAGLLYDGSGADLFEGRNFCQGAGAFGLGALVGDGRLPPPPGPEIQEDRAFALGLAKVPGTGGRPVRYDDNDTYVCASQSQGFGSTFGTGLLYDLSGSDVYRAGGRYLHQPLLPHDFRSLSQGMGIGFRPRAGGGVGILMDEEGNDVYTAGVYAQGVAYWYSAGLLFDGGGNDSYHATQYAQGAGVHLAVGSLWDRGGDDQYVSKLGVTQGTAHDLSVAWLLDDGGNDYYLVSDGQGVSLTNSVAVFIDGQGDDVYAAPGEGQGSVRWGRGFAGPAVFLDLEGRDRYPAGARGVDGGAWIQNTFGIGIDLDRDVTLPDEILPEIVLTAEDSLRAVGELFETASIWEVGSAREKVRRARKALVAKGMEAVDYVAGGKLSTRNGLEYRAIQELARAYPDSFAARVVPRLASGDPHVRRNVIRVLGDIRWRAARPAMEALLAGGTYREDWHRILEALGEIRDREAAPRIRPFLEDPMEKRRLRAVVALSALGDTASIRGWVDLLDDPVVTVRAAASEALRGIGPAAVEPLCRSLSERGTGRALRLRTLGRLAAALADSTDARSLTARSFARRALRAELEPPRGETSPGARAAAVEALLALREPEMEAFAREMLLDESDPLVKRTYEIGTR